MYHMLGLQLSLAWAASLYCSNKVFLLRGIEEEFVDMTISFNIFHRRHFVIGLDR